MPDTRARPSAGTVMGGLGTYSFISSMTRGYREQHLSGSKEEEQHVTIQIVFCLVQLRIRSSQLSSDSTKLKRYLDLVDLQVSILQ